MTNPEDVVTDWIEQMLAAEDADAFIDAQIRRGPVDSYDIDRHQMPCPHCGRQFHGTPTIYCRGSHLSRQEALPPSNPRLSVFRPAMRFWATTPEGLHLLSGDLCIDDWKQSIDGDITTYEISGHMFPPVLESLTTTDDLTLDVESEEEPERPLPVGEVPADTISAEANISGQGFAPIGFIHPDDFAFDIETETVRAWGGRTVAVAQHITTSFRMDEITTTPMLRALLGLEAS